MKLVLFDCDGTLADSQHMIMTAMVRTFVQHGLPLPPRAAILHTVGLSMPETMRLLVPDASTADHLIMADTYRREFRGLREHGKVIDPLFPGAKAALTQLARRSDVLLGLATGKSRRGVDALLEREGIAGLFATINTADDAPSKPAPDMILNALAETGVEPRHAIMVGDSIYDMLMAKAAGVKAVGVSWGYHTEANLLEAGASAIVRDFPALLSYVAGARVGTAA